MIRFERVTKIYPGSEVKVVDELDFEIQKGEICVLVGASGCGKTTTMRLINRLVDITSGTIYLDGQDISKMDPIELRLNIGYVIQEIGLFPHYSIEKNIGVVPIEKGWAKDRIKARVTELMHLMELDPAVYARKKPSALSGGQRQRVGVARALAADPPVMLMDEPFGALDPITRAKLQNEFLNLQAKIKKTIVFVTHDIDEAVKMGDKIAVMQNGKVVQFGTPHEILTRPVNEFVESLVGENRILKRFTLIPCSDFEGKNIFRLNAERELIIDRIQNQSRLDSHPVIGIVTDDYEPVGYIPIFKYDRNDPSSIESRIVREVDTVSYAQTSFDALGKLFSTGKRGVFCLDDASKARGLITITDLFEAVKTE